MQRIRFAGCLFAWPLIILSVCCDQCAAEDTSTRGVDFNQDVRPILSDKCFACHGPDAQARQAELRLDREDDAKRDRDGYRVLDADQPLESELLARITAEDEFTRMPPADSGKRLTAREIDVLRHWIEQGAPWAGHWAYEAPRRHPVPDVQEPAWATGWIDRFILARIEEAGLAPSFDADRVRLLRRVSFDLTGLPPTLEEADEFLGDESPEAWQKLVDRRLASPAFGERLAVWWLDLVRYADTVGYHGDQDHNISPYRDWVIDALNAGLPFDRFTREQLAGDLVADSGVDQKIASGYNRLLQTSHEGGVQAKEYLAIYFADRVRNLSAVWMGATMGCCQCHDHKYDPYTAEDFYSIGAFFADIDEAQHLRKGADRIPTVREPEIAVRTRRERDRLAWLESETSSVRRQLEALADDVPERKPFAQRLTELETQLKSLESSARLTMITVPIEPRPVRVLPRGNWLDDNGPLVEPGIPEFLGELDVGDRRANRLDLANWLTGTRASRERQRPERPSHDGAGLLTARVFANRFWSLAFGQGLSRSLDDFGGQGEPPSHPELLDCLAYEFVDGGWDIKHMLRRIVLSRTYRQSSSAERGTRSAERETATSSLAPRSALRTPRFVDSENRLFARQNRFRLPAEMIRDNALAVSGLLVQQLGGASVKPYQPADYYRHLNFPKRTYEHHADERQWRRGVYVHWQRQYLHPMLSAFDAPSREECTATRPRSNTPLAALALLNDPTFVEAARVFAVRILHEAGDDTSERLDFAFRTALSRPPDDHERQLLTDLLAASREEYARDETAARRLVETGLAASSTDLNITEWSAWTTVSRAILNLSETHTRN